MKTSTAQRENNYDLLRVLSAIAVVVIHANLFYFSTRSSQIDLGSIEYVSESLFNIVTRYSVPIFVMLSGAFILNNPKNIEFVSFYKKTSFKIVLPFLFLLAFLTLFSAAYHRSFMPIINASKGLLYNLWYMYMLIGLYLITPIILVIKKNLSSKSYVVVSIVYFIWTCLSQMVLQLRYPYTTSVVLSYAAYYVLGDVLYEFQKEKRTFNNKTSLLSGVICVVLIIITFFVRSNGVSTFLFDCYRCFFSPTIACYSICVFIFFAGLEIKKDFSKLSGYTYYIYLLHSFILNFVIKFISKRFADNEVIDIIFISTLTFLLSLVASIIFKHLWDMMMRKLNVQEKWLNLRIWKWLEALN